MDANVVSALIGGFSNLSTQLLSFGIKFAAIKNQPIPQAAINNYTIELPGTDGKTKIDFNLLILAFVVLIMVFAFIFIMLKLF